MAAHQSGDTYTCSQPFTFECHSPNCCESYNMRFLFLIGSLILVFVALIVGIIWVILELLPAKRKAGIEIVEQERRKSEVMDKELEKRSSEEANYLRRMSEINPHPRHEQY